MWGEKKREEPVTPMREAPTPPQPAASTLREPVREVRAPEPTREPAPRGGIATIGKSLIVKGNIGGTEDLYIDGEVEGSIDLRDNNITVGPNGRVNAGLHARDIVVLGRVKGNVRAVERLEIRKIGSLIGDIITARVVIEDGAYFKGSIDIQKSVTAATPATATPAPPATPAPVASATSTAPTAPAPASSAAAASTPASASTGSAPTTGSLNLSGEPKKY
jgi:cytoskeletal protein CcmA (bactofilin family)